MERATAPDGGRKPRVDDDEILDLFRMSPEPVLSTREVADELPIKRRGTLNRLQSLADAGVLGSKEVGGRNRVWWITDDVDEIEPYECPHCGEEHTEYTDEGTVPAGPDARGVLDIVKCGKCEKRIEFARL